MLYRRYHIASCPEQNQRFRDDAVEAEMNDRFRRKYLRCSCCRQYTLREEAEQDSPWFDALCPSCSGARPCDRCGDPLPPPLPHPLDGEYYCPRCLTHVQPPQNPTR